jgi:hypothetical protein
VQSPYAQPYAQPPYAAPRSSGPSTLTVVLLVIAGMSVLGVGGCFLVGLAAFASGQEDRKVAQETPPVGSAVPGSPAMPAAAPNTDDPSSATDEPDDPSGAARSDSDPSGPHAQGTTPPSSPATTGKTRWFCNATGWVRKCGFAGVCSSQMVFGVGSGDDRFMALQMAKNACENQGRIYGGTVCSVACSAKAK